MSDLGNPRRKKRPLSHETGFWRNIGERGKLHESDVFRLREDLKRMQEIVDLVGGGELPKELASELQQIQMQVERDFGTMTLALQTLIEILVEKGVMTEDEFEDKMEAIDLRDGIRDGKLHGNGETE